MRWVVGCLVLLAAGRVSAEMVVQTPPVVRACRQQPSWPGLMGCLDKLGTVELVRSLPGARLVRLTQHGGPTDDDAGVYLYVLEGGSWHLGGMFDGGSSYEVIALEPVAHGHHTGYRLDIGETLRSAVSLDGATSTPSVMMLKRSVYCSGDGWSCPDVTTSCDVLVRGRALWSFRGTVRIEGNELDIAGDRRLAGPQCAVPERVFLGWPDPAN